MNLGIEIVSVLFNVAYIVLASRESIWCWPMGILGSATGCWLFIEVKLYAEAVLFSYYALMGIYGWLSWRNSGRNQLLSINERGYRFHFIICGLGYVLTALFYLTLIRLTDAEMPLLDAFTTAFSFIATWMVARKILENWIYWIAIDALSIYLYLARGLEVYALLSSLYTAMAVYGYVQWRKTLQSNPV